MDRVVQSTNNVGVSSLRTHEHYSVDVSVIIPTLNEAPTIESCISKILQAFTEEDINGEIILSDSSQDETPVLAERLGVNVQFPDKLGYGYAYLYGLKEAHGKYIIMGDGDDTYDFLEIPKLLAPLQTNEADLVMGSRFLGSMEKNAMPWLHRYVGNPLLTFFLNAFFKTSLSDTHCGFRAIKSECVDSLRLTSHGMEFASEMLISAAKRGLRIREVPISYYPRQGSESKLRSFSDGWRHLKFMLFYAPNFLYFYPGFLMLMLGLFLTVISYFEIKLFYSPGIHTLIGGCFLLILSFQMLYLGFFSRIYSDDHYSTNNYIYNALKSITLEKSSFIGISLTIIGVVYLFTIISKWLISGYSELPLRGQDVLALTSIILGFQIFFNSFHISYLAHIRSKNNSN